MLLSVPFSVSGELFKYKAMPRIFKALSLKQPMTASTLMRAAQVPWKTSWTVLRLLERAEYVRRSNRKYAATDVIGDEAFFLNLRDCLTDELFRWRATRALLYLLYTKPHCSLRELSQRLGVSYETVKAIVKRLRKINLVRGGEVEEGFLVNPADAVELVPRIVHREVVRHFLSALKTYIPEFSEAVVVFGDASWGKPTFELALATVVSSPDPDRMLFIAKKLVYASESVAVNYGARINLTMMARYVWPQLKLNIVDYDKPSLESIVDGICVYGSLPRDEELLELGRAFSPWPNEVIQEKLEKGYIVPIGDGKYAYTEKAIKVFREKRSKVVETQIEVDGKRIRLVGVAPPHSL